MKISIIIPVYKVELYIRRCIESVINQDYNGLTECIVIDDCSPDNSIKIVETCVRNYKGQIEFHIIHHKINKGLSAARNTGIRISTGEYLYFLDADDYIEKDCLRSLVQIKNKYSDVDLIQAGANACWGDFGLEGRNDLPDYTENKLWIKKAFLKRTLFPVTSWNKLIKKNFIIKNNLFFKEGIIHEDEHWNFFACKYLTSFAVCKKNTYNYIVREGNIMGYNDKKKIISWIIIMNDFIEGIDPVCRVEQIRLIFERIYPIYVFKNDITKKKCYVLFRKLYKKCSFIGKCSILFILQSPNFIIKSRFVYQILMKRILLPLF